MTFWGMGGAAAIADTIDVQAPIRITATLQSDVPAFDLCWSEHGKTARIVLADRIAKQMTDPGRLYTIDLPDLPGTYRSADVHPPRDMRGKVIRRRTLNDGRRTYVEDLEGALSEVLGFVREARPEVRLQVVSDRRQITSNVTSMGDFVMLRQSTNSSRSDVTFTKRSPSMNGATSRGSAVQARGTSDRRYETRLLDDGKWLLWNNAGTWKLRTGDEFPDSFLSPSEELRNKWLNAQQYVVDFPTRQERPFGSQHGATIMSDVDVMPAEYLRQSEPFVAIPLSWKGTADQEPDNPRGWRRRYRDLPTQGWSVLDPYMQQIEDFGVREVWFWGWSGQHPDQGGYTRTVMPWFGTDGHTPIMRQTWSDFVERWQARGFTFGYWLGGSAIPNFGTITEPEHRYITREDFDHVADTLVDIRNHGFDAVGLDAFKWIMVQVDMPRWANWQSGPLGYRDKGISLDLLDHLRHDERLGGMHIVTENRVPYGEYLAKTPTFQLFSSTGKPRGHRPTIETITPPTFENIVNPGHEIIMMVSTDGWTRDEYDASMARLVEYGYRQAVTIEVLFEVGIFDNYGIEDELPE